MCTLMAPSLGHHGGCQDYRWPEWPALGSKHTICFAQNVPEADGQVLFWGPLVACASKPAVACGMGRAGSGAPPATAVAPDNPQTPEPLGGHPASGEQTAQTGRNSLLNEEAGGAWEDGPLPTP